MKKAAIHPAGNSLQDAANSLFGGIIGANATTRSRRKWLTNMTITHIATIFIQRLLVSFRARPGRAAAKVGLNIAYSFWLGFQSSRRTRS
jgi:hypothetical protein